MFNELNDVALYTSRDYTTRPINLNLNWLPDMLAAMLSILLAGFPPVCLAVCRLAAWLFWWLAACFAGFFSWLAVLLAGFLFCSLF